MRDYLFRVLLTIAILFAICSVLLVRRSNAMAPTQFGTYSADYLDRRQQKVWRKACAGAGRYQAMSEAYDKRRANPCDPKAREWVR